MPGAQQKNKIMTEHGGRIGRRFGKAKIPEKYDVEPDITQPNPC